VKRESITFSKYWSDRLSDYVTSLTWSPNGEWLATASAAGDVCLYHPLKASFHQYAASGQSISRVAFSSDNHYLAAGGQDGYLSIWDLRSDPNCSAIFSLPGDGPWIDQLAWHPQKALFAYGVGSRVCIWDIEQPLQIAELDFQNSSVLHLAWHPQGDLLAVSGHGGIKVWNRNDWRAEPKLIAVPGASLYSAWSADGQYLASGNLDRTLTVADWNQLPPWLMQGFPGKVRQVAWSTPSRSGAPIIAAACVEGVTVWERNPKQNQTWTSRVLQYHKDTVNAIAFQPNSFLLASAGQDGRIAIWDASQKLSHTIKVPSGGCSNVAWNPLGTLLAGASSDGNVIVWRLENKSKGFG
jgi:WD40 repeat protein